MTPNNKEASSDNQNSSNDITYVNYIETSDGKIFMDLESDHPLNVNQFSSTDDIKENIVQLRNKTTEKDISDTPSLPLLKNK